MEQAREMHDDEMEFSDELTQLMLGSFIIHDLLF